LNDNKIAKTAVGALGWGMGLAPGALRGVYRTGKGAVEGGYFLYRLTDPYDRFRSAPGQSATEQVLKAGVNTADYATRAFEDPSIVRDDIAGALHKFRVEQDPFATPAADTLGGEFRRTFDVGMNNGELAFDTGSLLVGGEFLRGAAGMGALAKAPGVKEIAYLAEHPGTAARFELGYKGMGHHIVERSSGLPSWLIESKFNKIREDDISTRDLYRNHYGVAGHFFGSAIPKKYGGGSWSVRDLGWTEYGPWDKLRYGTSPHTKAVVGPILIGGDATHALEGDGEDR
jgi:hypothetical protein